MGNLVFQGTADGRFAGYNAKTGAKLWETATGTGVVAAPTTYEVDGKQYVSIAVGWGGVYGMASRATERKGPGTVYTFALGGAAKAPEFAASEHVLLKDVKYDPVLVKEGMLLYVSNCVLCHGVPDVSGVGGNVPNLGYSTTSAISDLERFVLKGPHTEAGMPDFTGKLKSEEIEKIKAFVQGTVDAIRPK